MVVKKRRLLKGVMPREAGERNYRLFATKVIRNNSIQLWVEKPMSM